MAQISGFYPGDAIEQALTQPMDWGKLESLAYDVLVADDFPALRKIGGVGDGGMDAVEEAFYGAERKVTTVIQVTSAHGQQAKVRDTLTKLQQNGIETKHLVFLTRHPVTASTRAQMVASADKQGVTLDVRDQAYLIAQLSEKLHIFTRYFGDARAQLSMLLDAPDPLHTASDRLQHALLATLGAFVLHERAHLVRGALFEKTVLAALAASPQGTAGKLALLTDVQKLLPEENISGQQLDAAIDRLTRAGECSYSGDNVVCSEAVLLRCLATGRRADNSFKNLHAYVLSECRKREQLTDALHGYLERNLRRSIVHLLRASGPLPSEDDQALKFDQKAAEEVHTVLGQDLPPEIARAAIVAFSSFVTNPTLGVSLAPLVKSYAALAMRNLDPIGRRWQQMVLSRSVIAIDTDVLLYVVVEELPEHNAILTALQALQASGVEVVVPEHVFSEAVGHLERAPRTYKRFADRLLNFPPELVNARIWHAVVRGFYYAKRQGYSDSFDSFYSKYHFPQNPVGFTEHLLSKRLPLTRKPMDEVPEHEAGTLISIAETILQYREQVRRKALFRDDAEMAQRVRDDVAMALVLAAKANDNLGSPAKGYIASSDRAFRMVEEHENWPPRKHVHLWSNALPQLSFFACGSTLSPNDAVGFLFSPVTIAAADLMAEDISILATIGVDLKSVSLDRLDWDLRQNIGERLDDLKEAVISADADTDEVSADAALRVAQAASQAGYTLPSQIKTLVVEFDSTKEDLANERRKRQQLEEQVRELVTVVRQQSTSKTRRKFNKIIQDVGVHVDDELDN